MKRIAFSLVVSVFGMLFLTSYVTVKEYQYGICIDYIQDSVNLNTCDIYRIPAVPFVQYLDGSEDVDCVDFVTSSFFELFDTMPERYPGHTGLYKPSISMESALEMIDVISNAVRYGITAEELSMLINEFEEYHWYKYPIHFSPFRMSEDILTISSVDIFTLEETMIFSREDR